MVLSEALFQVALEFQNVGDVIEVGAGVFAFFLLQHWLLVHCFWRLVTGKRRWIDVARRDFKVAKAPRWRAQSRNGLVVPRIASLKDSSQTVCICRL